MATTHKNFINGCWESSTTLGVRENPSDLDDIVGEYMRADERQTDQAIAAAAHAFPEWSLSSGQKRFDILDKIGSEILARKDELGQQLAREEGKTLVEAIGETARAGQIFKFFAGEALRIPGESLGSVRPGVDVEVRREPVGVVGIIAPWNFPYAIPAWKIAPALAYGNSVVFKPAELVSGCAWYLADIISRSGLPVGVFNLVMGAGRVVGGRIVENPLVDAFTFTGSVATGHQLLQTGAARQAKMQLEMGGKNPLVILNDADLDRAVECAIQGSFYSTGQRCTASSRLIVEQGIYKKFIEAMQKRMSTLVVGHALDKETQIGPVVDEQQLKQNISYIELGKKEGAQLLAGGEIVSRQSRGHFLTPALFAASHQHRISREEIFGPVASVIEARDYEHALTMANDTEFGLCSGICTNSLSLSRHFKRNVKTGMVMVNLPTAGVDYHVPFGGRKASSYGSREQGRYAAEFYTTVKTVYEA
ncbi:MAG: aldehyde dehydrogenase family protein [Pseudomonadota bacterium]